MMRFGLWAVLSILWADLARCQVYTFEADLMPPARSLVTQYAFFVYSFQDSPLRAYGQPTVRTEGLRAVPAAAGDWNEEDLKGYAGLQVSMIPYDEFWTLVDSKRFCTSDVDVYQGQAKKENVLYLMNTKDVSDKDQDWYTFSVPWIPLESKETTAAVPPASKEEPMHQTAVYILMISNCGNYSAGRISGSIIVRNSHGYLPGNEYHKLPFYGWLAIAYVGISILWAGLLMRRCSDVFHIQWYIGAVILLGLIEAFLWWMFYNHWNTVGSRSTMFFCFALLMTVIKTISSYMLILVASLGWGITRPFLDRSTIKQIVIFTAVYIVVDFARQSILSFRHSHSISTLFVIICLAPFAMLNGTIFYWILMALSSLIESLEGRNQPDKLQLFQRLYWVLAAALSCASASVIFQIIDVSKPVNLRWQSQWLYSDALSHLMFMAVLLAMIYLWAPSDKTRRYQYKNVDDGARDVETTEVWDEDEKDEGDDSFWSATHGGSNDASKVDVVDASTIGAGGSAK